jgi:hypothetical protein
MTARDRDDVDVPPGSGADERQVERDATAAADDSVLT